VLLNGIICEIIILLMLLIQEKNLLSLELFQ
jgi:hypothetical protein